MKAKMREVLRQMPHLAPEVTYRSYTSRCQTCRQVVLIHEVRMESSMRTNHAECPYCRGTAIVTTCTAVAARPTE